MRWTEPILETQPVHRTRAVKQLVSTPQRETVEVAMQTPQLEQIDGRWVRRTAEHRRTIERPVVTRAALHGEDGAPLLDDCGQPATAEVPVLAEVEVERTEPFVEPASVQLGEKTHLYAVGAVPAGVSIPDHAERFIVHEKVLNPQFDPARPYQARQARPEWDVVALGGQARVRSGERTGARWVRIAEISPAVELWLVR